MASPYVTSACMDHNEGGDGTFRAGNVRGVVADQAGRKSSQSRPATPEDLERHLQVRPGVRWRSPTHRRPSPPAGLHPCSPEPPLPTGDRNQEADSYAFTQKKEEPVKSASSSARKPFLPIQAHIRGTLARSNTLKSTLFQGCFGEWVTEDMEELNQRHAEAARINAELKAWRRRKSFRATAEAQAQTEWSSPS